MMKINLKSIGLAFLVILLILIFFSKTIYNYNLPMVTAVSPQNGRLNKLELTTGIAQWANVSELYSEFGGEVEDILVHPGDQVTAGQELVYLSFDLDDIEQKLKEIAVSQDKLTVDMENIDRKLNKANHIIDTFLRPDSAMISDYDNIEAPNEVAQSRQNYETLKILFETGAVAKQELDNAAYELQKLYDKYEDERQALTQELKTKNLELKALGLQNENYTKTLSDYHNNIVLCAPGNATLLDLAVKKGQHINAHQFLARFGTGNEYEITCDISLDNNFVSAGDRCKLVNSSHSLEGVVTHIDPYEQAKKVTVALQAEDISPGETFEVRLEKESAVSATLVPNGAINKDSDGYFLYQIKQRKGILGQEYYAEKLRIYIGDSDDENTVVVKGVTFFEPIVLLSDKPFAEYDTIKIKNEGDFFEY